jgi:uncharacterized glyoxalase superfamily protein PhnB
MSDFLPQGAPPEGYQTVSPYLLYADANKIVAWLESLGFVERRTAMGAAGRTHHELVLGDDGLVMLGQMGPSFRSLQSQGVDSPVMVHIYVDDVAAVHKRAMTAGAEITDLETAPVGDRRFTATDPEGIPWVFAQRLASSRS